MPICGCCKLDKEISDFYKSKNKKGLRFYCKSCEHIKNNNFLEKTKDKRNEKILEKRLKNKHELLLSKITIVRTKEKPYLKLLIKSKTFGDQYILFDVESFDKIKDYTISLFGSSKNIYARLCIPGCKRYLLHRFIMDCPDDMVVDHINHNTLDNRKCNLRVCTQSENLRNQIGTNKYYKGVYKSGNMFNARIKLNGKNVNLGLFDSEVDAAKAYNQAALEYHGEFALLNEVC
jgi:hypothetical protein